MPRAVVEEFDESDLPPEDTLFVGVLYSVKEVERAWDDKFTGERVRRQKWDWTFKITQGEHAGRTVKGDTFATLRTGSQPYEWITALNGGQEPGVGEDIDTDHYCGNTCQFEVKHRPYKNRQQEDRIAVEIARVYPLNPVTSQPPF